MDHKQANNVSIWNENEIKSLIAKVAFKGLQSDIPMWKSKEKFEIDAESESRRIHNRWQEKYYELRSQWSDLVMWALLVMIAYQILLTVALIWLVLIGTIKFSEVQTILYMLSGQNFWQILWVVFLVVKFLFPAAPAWKKE